MARERGFTLIEVLVAFIIAAIALTALFRGAGTGLGAVRTAGRYEEAVSRAKSHLAAIGHDAALTVGDYQGDDGRGYHWHVQITAVATSKPRASNSQGFALPQAPSVGLYSVLVGISWTENGRTREFVLRTERLGPPADGSHA